MTIIDALQDIRLFGGLPAFKDLSSWSAWIVFLKAVYGLPMTSGEAAIFRHHTGRSFYDPPPGGWREIVLIVGRQAGKSLIASVVTDFEAITAPKSNDGTDRYCLLAAQDARAALRTLFSYAKAPFEMLPILQAEIEATTTETIRLKSGVVIAAYPCRPAAVRGIRARVVVCDELAFFQSTEMIPTDKEMLRALRPCLATTGGKLIVLSSPYGQTGALWELHRQHFGKDGAPVLVWQASAVEMNPLLPQDYLQRMEADDPEAYRAEVLGEFRSGIATFLDAEALAACVDTGVREREPRPGVQYRAFADPSGGRRDRFTVGIAHAENGQAVLDVARWWNAPFNPSAVIAEAAALIKTYRLNTITGDRFGAEFVTEGFRKHGVTYLPSEKDRSAIYLELLPMVNSGSVRLLDVPELSRELRGLERRRGTSGRDRVDHRPGSHDDVSNSCAGALALVSMRQCAPRIRSLADPPRPGELITTPLAAARERWDQDFERRWGWR